MNERILKLLKQSGLQPYYDVQEAQIEKFAELIVRECAGIIESQDVDPSFKIRMSWAVKKHFGVEE